MFTKDFEIIEIEEKEVSVRVEVEFSDRSRKVFSFPNTAEFLEEDNEGVPYFVTLLRERVGRVLDEQAKKKKKVGVSSVNSLKGRSFSARTVQDLVDEKFPKVGANLKAERPNIEAEIRSFDQAERKKNGVVLGERVPKSGSRKASDGVVDGVPTKGLLSPTGEVLSPTGEVVSKKKK